MSIDFNNRKHLLLAAAAFLLLLGGLAAWLLPASAVDDARSLRAQLFSKDQNLSAEERRELGKKYRDQVQQLTPEQRGELMRDKQKEMAKEMARFSKLPAQEQRRELDKKIDQMAARMKKGGAGGQDKGGKNGGPPGGNARRLDGSWAQGFGGKKSSPEQRELRRQQMLDYGTPGFRAQMYEFRQMFNNRMKERGLQIPAFR